MRQTEIARVTPLRPLSCPTETWLEASLAELIAQAILIPGTTWPQRYLRMEMDALVEARAKLPDVPPDDPFEAWLIDRWLQHIRSPIFRLSADYHFLRAEWEHSFK